MNCTIRIYLLAIFLNTSFSKPTYHNNHNVERRTLALFKSVLGKPSLGSCSGNGSGFLGAASGVVNKGMNTFNTLFGGKSGESCGQDYKGQSEKSSYESKTDISSKNEYGTTKGKSSQGGNNDNSNKNTKYGNSSKPEKFDSPSIKYSPKSGSGNNKPSAKEGKDHNLNNYSNKPHNTY